MTSDAVGHRKHAIGHIVKKSRAGAAMQFIGTSFGDCFVRLISRVWLRFIYLSNRLM
jgi:hypothetical protein